MGELEELEELLDQLLNGIQSVIQSGEVLSDEFQGMLAKELEWITNRTEELRQGQSKQSPQIESTVTPSAQLMWILAGQNVDAFVNYLGTYPDPELQNLLRNPAQLDSVVNRLMQMMPPGQQLSQDGIQHADLNSSNIYGFKYDKNSGKLLVRFQGGSVYGYDGVPPNVFKAFQQGAIPAKTTGQNQYGKWWEGKSPSLGASFYELIKMGGYNYNKLN